MAKAADGDRRAKAGGAAARAKANAGAKAAAEPEKSEGQALFDKLSVKRKSCWEGIAGDANVHDAVFSFAEDYKQYLDKAKTEREFVAEGVALLRSLGFQDMEDILPEKKPIPPGTKIYQNLHGKSLIFAVIGEADLIEGVNIVGAHVDSPRVDIKTNPLYEDSGLAMLDTQYYGGIKKYQWVTIPLALHGVLIRGDGKKVDVRIGEGENDPVFTITDLLPHLARKQMEQKASDFIPGEGLNILAGSIPYNDEKVKERVKLNILNILHERFGIVEEDFAVSELEAVPAGKARDIGFDRSLVGAYGHDDRCCAYAAMRAALDAGSAPGGKPPRKTVVCLLTDKEEVGSMGNTGAASAMLENFLTYINYIASTNCNNVTVRKCLTHSSMLSADVNSAVDPNFGDVQEKKTASFVGHGLVLTKYTGGRGKGGGSDANAEYLAKVRKILNDNGVQWQYGDIGKVDQGGGGTIAYLVADLGVEVLDCGLPVLSMHAPFEVISKVDLYTAYKGYVAFLRDA